MQECHLSNVRMPWKRGFWFIFTSLTPGPIPRYTRPPVAFPLKGREWRKTKDYDLDKGLSAALQLFNGKDNDGSDKNL